MMLSFGRVLVALLAVGEVLALPAVEMFQSPSACTTPKKRRSWHTLSDTEKKEYLDAEVCLMKKPTVLKLRGAKTRFDELQAVHVYQAEIAHFVGTFFPFHRAFMFAHEQLLEKECGYTAGQPYWDESVDAGMFNKSTLFDPVLGFGGNGVGATGCIQDGPFADYKNPIGPGYALNDHCIQRQISDFFSVASAQAQVDACMARTNYIDFWHCVEAGPHGGGHGGVGAQMLNPISSPGDPLFYMHHTWLDSIWARWQDKNPLVRLNEIGGNNKIDPNSPFRGGPPGGIPPGVAPGTPGMPAMPGMPGMPGSGAGAGPPPGFGPLGPLGGVRPADVPEPQVIGDTGNETTLTHLIQMYEIVPNMTVAEVMDTRAILCYEYD